MNTNRGLSGKDIIVTLVALVLLIAVVLLVLTAALNGFLERFSRPSLQAIAVLLVYAIVLAFPLGILVGYAWCTARSNRLTLPPIPAHRVEQKPAPAYPYDPSFSAVENTPRLPDQPRLYSAAEEQRLMKIMEDLDA